MYFYEKKIYFFFTIKINNLNNNLHIHLLNNINLMNINYQKLNKKFLLIN